MGIDIHQEIERLITEIKGFNNDPAIVDQRVKALVITKLEEAGLWVDKLLK